MSESIDDLKKQRSDLNHVWYAAAAGKPLFLTVDGVTISLDDEYRDKIKRDCATAVHECSERIKELEA